MNAKPQVNGSLLPAFKGKTVVLLGIAEGPIRNGTFEVKASDGKMVHIDVPEDVEEEMNSLVQVIGTVQPNCHISCTEYSILPEMNKENFDMEAYDKAIKFMHAHEKYFPLI
ncbi:DgyrCDS127 [Dimorphilus gyrociliatus]|uniref:DgyrCDS127 n=1 Tax=Dimorphilus gyrociliatus TaxID=2664684 RepID=A0A7I8V570_9ANNE|nr:DgyrCDS127 [Dimorphilus gyrociliatus]